MRLECNANAPGEKMEEHGPSDQMQADIDDKASLQSSQIPRRESADMEG